MALLVLVLAGLLVWAGTLSPADAQRDFPSEDDVGPNRDAYVGERVTLSGTVVGTDPLVVDIEYGTGESFRATPAGRGDGRRPSKELLRSPSHPR